MSKFCAAVNYFEFSILGFLSKVRHGIKWKFLGYLVTQTLHKSYIGVRSFVILGHNVVPKRELLKKGYPNLKNTCTEILNDKIYRQIYFNGMYCNDITQIV